jgi:acyl dehydratase
MSQQGQPMNAAVLHSAKEYQDAVGRQFGPTGWLTVEQERIDLFAEATGDHQWIHVDTERARTGPFGATIAHGYLSLSLVNYFLPDLVRPEGMKHGVNYGCDRVRFPAALKVGTRVRGRAEIVAVDDLGGGAVQAKIRVTIEAEGVDKPVCVADTLSRLYF